MSLIVKSLWSIKFVANEQDFGSGIVILNSSEIIGGNHGHYYLGQYALSNNTFQAMVTVTNHNPNIPSVFGSVTSFQMSLTGEIDGDRINLSGHIDGYSTMRIIATMRKLENLA